MSKPVLTNRQRIFLEKWIKALRSGAYNQGQDRLLTRNECITRDEYKERFCCLGVLCNELNFISPGTTFQAPSGSGIAFRHDSYIGEFKSELPSHVLQLIGMDSDFQMELIDMNDNLDYNFNQIADEIESHFNIEEDSDWIQSIT